MKQHRQNCVWCGKGFQAFPSDQAKFCKKKCAIADTVNRGMKWEKRIWKARKKKEMSYEDKMKYAEEI